MQNDVVWVQQTLAGDKEMFHHLVRKYQSVIYNQILSQVENPDDAQELTQEVFLEAYRDLNSLKQPEYFSAWLRQIARNHCLDWLRKKRDDNLPLQENIVARTSSAEENLILQETYTKDIESIDKLSAKESDLLKSRYLEGASYEELQAKHGLSYKVVTMRLIRARNKVRAQLKNLLYAISMFPLQKIGKELAIKGVLEAMKIGIKTKILVAGALAVLVLGGTGTTIWYSRQSARETTESSVIQTPQKVASVSQVAVASSKKLSKIDDKAIDKQNKDTQEKTQIDKTTVLSNLPKESLRAETKPQEESPAELLERYMKVSYSPEYQAELQKIFQSMEPEIQPYHEKVMNLKTKEKELERDLENSTEENRSKIQDELAKTKADLWEAEVDRYEKSVLIEDAID
jgi:RNA polymerase sigma-70 factor, ECF subfamily